MKSIVYFLAFFTSLWGNAQLSESFSDGDFTTGTVWAGTPTNWLVVSGSDVASGAIGSNTLRLNAATGGGLQYLSTRIPGAWGMQQSWSFWMGRRAQAATGANIIYVWLYATEPNVTTTTVDGYRIRFGDDQASGDRVVLESITNGVATTVISATGSVPNGLTDFGFQVRVTRSASGLWSLFTSTLPQSTGTGDIASDLLTVSTTSIAQGTGTNNSITIFDNGYIAFAALHTSAAAARTGAEFDQLLVALGAPSSLPVTFGQIRASETNSGVRLYWENLTETDVVSYQVERSKDGTNFNEIARLLPVKNDGGQAGYQYTDGNPDQGNNYYRLRVTESNRNTTYSPIIRINTGRGKTALDLYPNPARNTILLEAEHLSPGIYQVSIRNGAGQLTKKIQVHTTGSLVESINIRDYPPGPYFLELTGALRMIKVFVVQ